MATSDTWLRSTSPRATEAEFWHVVREALREYQARHPDLKHKFDADDVFSETFLRSCLNRLQLRNNRQMVDLSSPAAALQFAGTLDNPIASR
jgi:siderophore synthetase component